MNNRGRTLAALTAATTSAALAGYSVARSLERHLVRGESMKPTLQPTDTVISARTDRLLGRLVRPRPGAIAVIALPWEHDLLGIKRLVAGPGSAWEEDGAVVRAGEGWVAVGDERTLSTDSRHHGRVPTEHIRGIVIARVRRPDEGQPMIGRRDAVSARVAAPPDTVYDLLTTIERMGEWSPETFRARWRRGSSRAVPGARFRGWNRRGWQLWFTDPTVTEADPGRVFSFETGLAGRGPFTRWTFRLTPTDDGGTEVEESWEQLGEVPGFTKRFLSPSREAEMRSGMQQTLQRLKVAAESV